MEKQSNRQNVLKEFGDNLLHSIINAIHKGYTPKIVFADIIEELNQGNISRGKFQVIPDALNEWLDDYSSHIKELADMLKKHKLPEEKPTKKIDIKDLRFDLKKQMQPGQTSEEVKKAKMHVEVSESWPENDFDEDKNILKGQFILNFKEDLSEYVKNRKIDLKSTKIDLNDIYKAITIYLYKQYKWLKKGINIKKIISNFQVKDAKKGILTVNFIIREAE